jgi:hypothetical protein
MEIGQQVCHCERMGKMNGYILDGQATSNVIAGGGLDYLQFIAVAESSTDAIALVHDLGFPDAEVVDSGAAILAEARELGIFENTAITRPEPPRAIP